MSIYFFALLPDGNACADVERRVDGLRDDHRLQGKPIPPRRLHVSLHPFAGFIRLPGCAGTAIRRAADVVRMPPFRIEFDSAASFGGGERRPLVLLHSDDLPALSHFYARLGTEMRKVGLRPAGRRFTPHMTVLYDNAVVRDRAVEPVAWTAREFVLVHSFRNSRGEREHEHLARWPLAA
ncbi:MAG: 2'-5' RNA ligase family protein [Parvibaculaceae bacterium]